MKHNLSNKMASAVRKRLGWTRSQWQWRIVKGNIEPDHADQFIKAVDEETKVQSTAYGKLHEYFGGESKIVYEQDEQLKIASANNVPADTKWAAPIKLLEKIFG